MSKQDFTYAVSRIRMRETKLFSAKTIERLISLPDYEAVVRTLIELGYGDETSTDKSDLIKCENNKLWSLISELNDDMSVFDVFRLQNDFHNIKVCVKSVYSDVNPQSMFVSGGIVDCDKIYNAVKSRDYSELTYDYSQVIDNALETILKTGDGQLCDMIIDKACLTIISNIANTTSIEAIKDYAEVFVASANIKIAVRGARFNKSYDFFIKTLADSILNKEKLSLSATKGFDEICEYLDTTKFKDATEYIKKGIPAFEKWCDDFLINKMKAQKSEPFSAGPLIAYIIAKQNELKTVRLILVAKLNGLQNSIINERIREMYV